VEIALSILSRITVPLLLLVLAAPLAAQPLCRGDVDGDGFVTTADVGPMLEVLFDVEGFTATSAEIADLNLDDDVSAADVVGVILLDGLQCPGGGNPTPTRTGTQVRTPTPTRTQPGGSTPTPTPTRTPTAAASTTPTTPCSSMPLATGTTNGTLAAGDCVVDFNRDTRLTDEYTFTGVPGQALRIAITATGFTPYVRVIDPNGWFDAAEGGLPAEIRLTSDRPYTILVTSRPGTPSEAGSYAMSVSTRACATETLTTKVASFDGTECPDPAVPTLGGLTEFADVYTFNVAEPLTLIAITMRQGIEDSLVDPMIAVYGPGGFEAFPAFQADDLASGGFGFDAAARFLAHETGTYTVVATSGGCDPEDEFKCGYRIQFASTTCAATAIADIPSASRKPVSGVHWGDTLKTRCGAPLPIPGSDDDGIPEIGSPADMYRFDGNAGDVITLELESEDEGQLYLYGPANVGVPLLGVDGDSSGNLLAQIGVVLPYTGSYTVVAANRNYLIPPDPEDPEDEGEFVAYTLFVQKCPVQGGLNVATGAARADNFTALDCIGSGDVPVRSYAVSLTAGTFVDATMTAASFDSVLSLVGPDGTRFTNDDDPLNAGTRHARLGRIVPLTGTYYLEATAPLDETAAAGGAFSLRARTCATTPAAPALVAGSLADADCALDDGRRFDVVTYDAPADASTNPSVAGIVAGDGTCVLAVLPSGPTAAPLACAEAPLEVPVARTGRHAWLVVGASPSARGPYSLDFARCEAEPMAYGSALSGLLQPTDCVDAAGRVGEWFVLREPAGWVRFARGASGTLTTGFASRFSVAGADATAALPPRFAIDTESFYTVGGDLLAVLRLQGESVASQGAFDLEIDVPDRRE
jgi:hypothetical protein